MRLVHVASGRLFGGIEQMLVTMARERRVTPDVSVTFVVAAPARLNRLCQELDASGATVHALGDVRLSRPASIVRARSRLRRVLAARAGRCGHLSCAMVVRDLCAGGAPRAGMPVVLWQHDRAEGRSLVERWAARTRADLVICNSRVDVTDGRRVAAGRAGDRRSSASRSCPSVRAGARTNLRRRSRTRIRPTS